MIVDEMLTMTTNPSKKLVMLVAQDCVKKYSCLEYSIDMMGFKLGIGQNPCQDI